MKEALESLKTELSYHLSAADRIQRAIEVLVSDGHIQVRRHWNDEPGRNMIERALLSGNWLSLGQLCESTGKGSGSVAAMASRLYRTGRIRRRGVPSKYEYALPNGKG
jgi:hypothetical protein